MPIGVYNQIQVAWLDPNRANQINWINYDPEHPGHCLPNSGLFRILASQRTGELRKQVPFTSDGRLPSRTWKSEVNDPIVHYTKDDLVTDVSGGIPADAIRTRPINWNDPVTLQDLFSGAAATYTGHWIHVIAADSQALGMNSNWRTEHRLVQPEIPTPTDQRWTTSRSCARRPPLCQRMPSRSTVSGRMWRVFDTSTPNSVILSGAEMRELEDATQITRLIGPPGSGASKSTVVSSLEGGGPRRQNTTIDKLRNYNHGDQGSGYLQAPDSLEIFRNLRVCLGRLDGTSSSRHALADTLYMKSRPEPETDWVSWAEVIGTPHIRRTTGGSTMQ